MEIAKTLPGDRGLEGRIDDPGGDQNFPVIGHANERFAPRTGRPGTLGAIGRGRLAFKFSTKFGADLKAAIEPALNRMIRRLKCENHDCVFAVARAVDARLCRIEQTNV